MNNTGIIAYRVLLTGIPVKMSCETFYDYLRSHVCDCGLYNALLICPPSRSVEEPVTRTRRSLIEAMKRKRKGKKANVGAALVDFVSKAFADAARSMPFRIGKYSHGLKWESLGFVSCLSTCIGHKNEQHMGYISLLADDNVERTLYGRNYGRQMYKLACRRYLATRSFSKEKKGKSNKKDMLPGIKYVGENHLSSTASSEASRVSDKEWKRKSSTRTFEDVEIFLSTPSLSCRRLSSVHLFSLFQSALRRLCLGSVHSIRRLAFDEAIITTDADTSAALHQKGQFLCHTSWLHDHRTGETVLQWFVHSSLKTPADNVFFCTDSFSLATKEETLAAIAHLYSIEDSTKVAYKDKYGNLLLRNKND